MSDNEKYVKQVIEAHDECKRTYDKWQNAIAAELRGELSLEAVEACYDLWRIAMDDAVALRVNWHKQHARQDQQQSVDDTKRDSSRNA
jgi:hypothetical protein